MKNQEITVEICTIPQEACDASKANWQQTAQFVSRQLNDKFGNAIKVEHIEFMSPQWFQNEMAMKILEAGQVNFPFVMVNDEVACADKKINVSKINKTILSILNK